MRTIEVKDFSRATFIDIDFPACEHPEEYRDVADFGFGENTQRMMFCRVCKMYGTPEAPDEDGEIFYDWRLV